MRPGIFFSPRRRKGRVAPVSPSFKKHPTNRTAQCAAKDSPCRGTATARFLRNASAPKTAFIAQRPARTAPVASLSSRNAAKRPGAFQKQERPCRNWQGLWLPYQKLIQFSEMSRRGKNGERFSPRTPKGGKVGDRGVILEDARSYPLRPSICLDMFRSKRFTTTTARLAQLLPAWSR